MEIWNRRSIPDSFTGVTYAIAQLNIYFESVLHFCTYFSTSGKQLSASKHMKYQTEKDKITLCGATPPLELYCLELAISNTPSPPPEINKNAFRKGSCKCESSHRCWTWCITTLNIQHFCFSLDKILGAITIAAERNNGERFSNIVEGLENHEALQLQVRFFRCSPWNAGSFFLKKITILFTLCKKVVADNELVIIVEG